jgi:hypothetical protein
VNEIREGTAVDEDELRREMAKLGQREPACTLLPTLGPDDLPF